MTIDHLIVTEFECTGKHCNYAGPIPDGWTPSIVIGQCPECGSVYAIDWIFIDPAQRVFLEAGLARTGNEFLRGKPRPIDLLQDYSLDS